MEQPVIDKVVGYFAPKMALQRMAARESMQIMAQSSGYIGARKDRLTDGWVTTGSSADWEIGFSLETLRNRARDLVRNDPYANKAVRAMASNLIGTGIKPKFTGENASQMEDLWAEWVEKADYDEHTDFYGLQKLIARAKIESGECLIIERSVPVSSGLKIPLQLQVLETDYIDIHKNETRTSGGGKIVQGIEFDRRDKRIAYWLYKNHPGDYSGSGTSKRVPAKSVHHFYDRTRPGQNRGVPDFTPVIAKMHDLGEYDAAELFAKKIQACFSLIITKLDGTKAITPTKTKENGKRQETMRPGQILYTKPGEDVKSASPPISQGYREYNNVQLHGISCGIGLPYELVTGDFSEVNFTSMRAGLIEFREWVRQEQKLLYVPGICKPIYHSFAHISEALGIVNTIPKMQEWSLPRFPLVDPESEVDAEIKMVRAGIKTLADVISEQGKDWMKVFHQRALELGVADELGLISDTDPRKVNRAGLSQDERKQRDDANETK